MGNLEVGQFKVQPSSVVPEGAYAGPLYETSAKIGESAPIQKFVDGMERNGIALMIGYFFLDGPQREGSLERDEDLGYLVSAVRAWPDRIVPYFSPGYEPEKSRSKLGPVLTKAYEEGYQTSSEIVGPHVLAGIGELEIHDWDVAPDDPQVQPLLELADSAGLGVMFHLEPGESNSMARVLETWPNVTFLIHMYPEDLDEEFASLLPTFDRHPNLFYTLNADHMLYDDEAGTGLLYKYQGAEVTDAIDGFTADYEAKSTEMLGAAHRRFDALVTQQPDRVMWGTEANPHYNFEPEVYDRVISFTREFLGAFNETVQRDVAFENALRVYGWGVRCDERVDRLF